MQKIQNSQTRSLTTDSKSMKVTLLTFGLAMSVFGCKKPNTQNENSVVNATKPTAEKSGLADWTTAGVGHWETGSKPTWVFSYGGERKAGETPQAYLKSSQAFYEDCVQKAKASGSYIKGNCDNNGVPRGYGLYFAEDPFVSATYGSTLTVFRIKPGIKFPSLIHPDSTGYYNEYTGDILSKLWQTNVPGNRYFWGSGGFTAHALVVKDFDQVAVKDTKGDIEAWSFSVLKSSPSASGGRPFNTHPGIKCASGQSLPTRLGAWVDQMYFMKFISKDTAQRESGQFGRQPSMLTKDEKSVSKFGILAAIVSEINARTPDSVLGFKQAAQGGRGSLQSYCSSLNFSCIEALEVFIEAAGQEEGSEFGDDTIRPGEKEWFAAFGLVPASVVTDTKVTLKLQLGKIIADTWKAKNPKGAARVLEAYEMGKCIRKDLEPESLAKWTFKN